MRRYGVTIHDVDSNPSAGTAGALLALVRDDDLLGAERRRELNGEWSLTCEIDIRSLAVDQIDVGKCVHLVDRSDAAAAEERYVVRSFTEHHRADGRITMQVECEHRGNWLLAGHVVRHRCTWEDHTPASALANILEGSLLSAGTVTPTDPVTVAVDYSTALELVRKLCEDTGYDYRVNDDNTVDIVALGSTKPHAIKYKKNLKAVTRESDGAEFATVVIPVAAGEPPVSSQHHRLKVSSLVDNGGASDDVVYLDTGMEWAIPSDGSFVGKYLALWDTEQYWATTEHYGPFEIKASYRNPGSNPYFELPPNSISSMGGNGADYCSIVDSTMDPRPGVDYVEDKEAIDARGTVYGLHADDDLPPVLNLASFGYQAGYPHLDGPYTGGLCRGWYEVESINVTPSQNVDPTYIRQGGSSQKAVATSDGAGVGTKIFYTEGKAGKESVDYISVVVWLYLAAGSVRVYVYRDGATPASPFPPATDKAVVSEVGWNEVVLEGVDPQTAAPDKYVKLEIVQDGATGATFYVDAFVAVPFASVVPEFTAYHVPTELYKRASEDLTDNRSSAQVTYRVDLADYAAAFPGAYSHDAFDAGDTVDVDDELLGVSVSPRVIRKTTNLILPANCTVDLSNPRNRVPRSLADVIARQEIEAAKTARRARRNLARALEGMGRRPRVPGWAVVKGRVSPVASAYVVYDTPVGVWNSGI